MKEIALVLFSKTPGYSPIKTRLAKDIGSDFAEEIFSKSVEVTKKLIKSISVKNTKIDLVFALAERELPAHPLWKDEEILYQGDGELGDKLNYVYSLLLEKYDGVIFMGGDSPHIEKEQIILAIKKMEDSIILGPSEDGGFYLFAGSQVIDQKNWEQVEYSSHKTCQQLAQNLSEVHKINYIKNSFDIDKFSDLENYKTINKEKLSQDQLSFIDWVLNNFLTNK